MTQFSFLPLVKVIGKTEIQVNSTMVERVIVTEADIKFKLKHSESKEVKLIEFDTKQGIHTLHDDIGLPIELFSMTTIDFLEAISSKYKLSTILLEESNSNMNFVEIFSFMGDNKIYLPFQVRKPSTKTLYSSVFNLMPIKSNLMSPIEVLSDQYEDYLENALYSFLLNVSKPYREKEHQELIKSQELLKVLDRIEDLSQIMTGQIDNIRERYRAFSRIMVPLIQLANIKKKIGDSIQMEFSKNSISYNLKYPIEIPSEELAQFIANRIKSEQ